MTVVSAEATLRRGILARLRTIRVYELAAWVAMVVAAAEIVGGSGSGVAVAVLLGVIGLAVRIAIATESLCCDATGVSWRSTFVRFHVEWDEITAIEVTARAMRVWLLKGRTFFTVPCLSIERHADQPPLLVTPSVWVSIAQQAEFIAAARLISPTDWSPTER